LLGSRAGHLSKVQEIDLSAILGKTVTGDCQQLWLEVGYVRDVGSKLWQSLKGIWEEGHQNNFKESWQQYVARSVFAEEWRQAQGGVPSLLTTKGTA